MNCIIVGCLGDVGFTLLENLVLKGENVIGIHSYDYASNFKFKTKDRIRKIAEYKNAIFLSWDEFSRNGTLLFSYSNLDKLFICDEFSDISFIEKYPKLNFKLSVSNIDKLLYTVSDSKNMKIILQSSYHVYGTSPNLAELSELDDRLDLKIRDDSIENDIKTMLGYSSYDGFNEYLKQGSIKSIYGYHKSCTEQILLQHCTLYSHSLSIIRCSEILTVGECFLSRVFKEYIVEGALDVFDFSFKSTIDFINSDDVAKIFLDVSNSKNSDIFHLGGGYMNSMSIHEIFIEVMHELDLDIDLSTIRDREYKFEKTLMPAVYFSDNSKIKKIISTEVKQCLPNIIELFNSIIKTTIIVND